MTTAVTNKLQMKRIPKAGQYLMYVDLSLVKSMSIDEAIQKLEQMGYEPQLRYMDTPSGLKFFALLRDEQHDPAQKIPDMYRAEESEALHDAFAVDDFAVSVSHGLPRGEAIAA